MPAACCVCAFPLDDAEVNGRSGFLGKLGFGGKKDRECGACHAAFNTFVQKHSIPLPAADEYPAAMRKARSNPKLTRAYDGWAAEQRAKAAKRKQDSLSQPLRVPAAGFEDPVWMKHKAIGSPKADDGGDRAATATVPSFDNGILLKSWSRARLGDEEFDLPEKPRRVSGADDDDDDNDEETGTTASATTAREGDEKEEDTATVRTAGQESVGTTQYFMDEKTGEYYAMPSGGKRRVQPGDVGTFQSTADLQKQHSDFSDDVADSVTASVSSVEDDMQRRSVFTDNATAVSMVTQYFLDETTGRYCFLDEASGQYLYCEKPRGVVEPVAESLHGSVAESGHGSHSGPLAGDNPPAQPTSSRKSGPGHGRPADAGLKQIKGQVASEVKALKAQLKRTTELAVTAAVAAKQAAMQFTSPDIALKSWLSGVSVPEPNVKQIIATYKRIMRDTIVDPFSSKISVHKVSQPRPSPMFRSTTQRLLPRSAASFNPASMSRPTTMVQIVLPNGTAVNPALFRKQMQMQRRGHVRRSAHKKKAHSRRSVRRSVAPQRSKSPVAAAGVSRTRAAEPGVRRPIAQVEIDGGQSVSTEEILDTLAEVMPALRRSRSRSPASDAERGQSPPRRQQGRQLQRQRTRSKSVRRTRKSRSRRVDSCHTLRSMTTVNPIAPDVDHVDQRKDPYPMSVVTGNSPSHADILKRSVSPQRQFSKSPLAASPSPSKPIVVVLKSPSRGHSPKRRETFDTTTTTTTTDSSLQTEGDSVTASGVSSCAVEAVSPVSLRNPRGNVQKRDKLFDSPRRSGNDFDVSGDYDSVSISFRAVMCGSLVP